MRKDTQIFHRKKGVLWETDRLNAFQMAKMNDHSSEGKKQHMNTTGRRIMLRQVWERERYMPSVFVDHAQSQKPIVVRVTPWLNRRVTLSVTFTLVAINRQINWAKHKIIGRIWFMGHYLPSVILRKRSLKKSIKEMPSVFKHTILHADPWVKFYERNWEPYHRGKISRFEGDRMRYIILILHRSHGC